VYLLPIIVSFQKLGAECFSEDVLPPKYTHQPRFIEKILIIVTNSFWLQKE